eukprot:CAMPEP_0185727238 /NCGR_PEP_ID=MMETSP1171-20130828/2974_1 /TAXON_ID=374046 /ORGANISM="Helicotheca tamensis, Strain CCMP826" /LENGTH=400 /DNA_ID=CAMNT_0028395757 /DNA_START=97 /DNA_END=1299 /DNA_ORIENTATION=-
MVQFHQFTSATLGLALLSLSSTSWAFTTPTAFTKTNTRRVAPSLHMVDPMSALSDLLHTSLTLASDTTASTASTVDPTDAAVNPTTAAAVASLMGVAADSITLPPPPTPEVIKTVEAVKAAAPPAPPAEVVTKVAEVVKATPPPPPPPAAEVVKAAAPKAAEVIKAASAPPAADVVKAAAPKAAEVVKAAAPAAASKTADAAPASGSYSKVSYYTTLALYAASFPGVWSQIKRSTSAKLKQKTYVSPGMNAFNGKSQREQAGEIMAYMKANNYEVQDAGEVITFRGLVQRSTSQAFFLVFCTALGMASLALVLQIQFQDLVLPVIGKPNWFYLCFLSPYAGIYYWKSGDRVDDIKVKLVTNDEETENEITIEGNDEEIERMWRTLNLTEKGMVKVEGILG